MQHIDITVPILRKSGIPLYTQIKDGLRRIILSMPAGSEAALPPQRDLAARLRVSRNTVGMAYAELERDGLIASHPGRGTVALPVASRMEERTQRERLAKTIEHSVEEALSLGLSLDEYAKAVSSFLAEKKRMLRDVRMVFVECNREQLSYFAEHLFLSEDVRIIPVLLEDIRRGRAEALAEVRSADIVVTSFYHLNELDLLLAGNGKRLVGIGLRPEMSTIVGIARIPTDARVGVVAASDEFLIEVGNTLVKMEVEPSRVRQTTEGDETELQRFVRGIDAVVVSPSRRRTVETVAAGKQIVEFLFAPDEASINNIRVALLELEQRRGNSEGGGSWSQRSRN